MVGVTLKMEQIVVWQRKKPGLCAKAQAGLFEKTNRQAIYGIACLAVAGTCNPLPTLSFALLAASVLAGLLIALFELESLEKAVVLNFFLQNTHGFFEIVIENFYFDFLQMYRPFLNISGRDLLRRHDG